NKIIFVDEWIAKYLPSAFPPTVSAAIKLVKKTDKKSCGDGSAVPWISLEISNITIVNALPLIIPEISPMTSLQKLANLSAFLYMLTASLAPVTFSAAIACKGASFAAVDAMPSISKMMPIKTINSTMTSPMIQETLFNNEEEKLEKIAANTKVITAMVKLNFIELFIFWSIYCPALKIRSFPCSLCTKEWPSKRLRLRLRSSRFSQIDTRCRHQRQFPFKSILTLSPKVRLDCHLVRTIIPLECRC